MSLLGHCLIFFVRAYQLVLSPLLVRHAAINPLAPLMPSKPCVVMVDGEGAGWL